MTVRRRRPGPLEDRATCASTNAMAERRTGDRADGRSDIAPDGSKLTPTDNPPLMAAPILGRTRPDPCAARSPPPPPARPRSSSPPNRARRRSSWR